MSSITVRHLKFDFEPGKDFDPEVIQGEFEMARFMVGLSMILPYLEPYLMRHSLAGQKLVKDPVLRQDMRQFSQQQAQHCRQHALFNASVRKKYPQLELLEKQVEADYQRFSKRGLKFNLAFAQGFESLSTAWAIFMCNSGMIHSLRGPFADIAAWHFLEEVEHRSVAHDAYRHLYGGYGYRVWVSLIAQSHLIAFMLACTRLMLRAERDQFQARGGWSARLARIWNWTRLGARYLLPGLWKTYLPGADPRKLVVPPALAGLAEKYNARADKLITSF